MEAKKDLINRINRASGQLEGVAKMVEEDRACLDSVQQIAAIRSALAKVGVELLKNEASVCDVKQNPEDFERIIKELFKLS
ncbi:metal-sensitive transcriptional regulator [Candidatus Dojkabacteria bacterium]|nr:metal-sensitive transcriptional regulator [Candidatus Dojkabacteria bacterium]